MSRLLESIRLQNGNFHRLSYHQQRMDRSVKELYGEKNSINLFESLKAYKLPSKIGLYKCRVVYTKPTRISRVYSIRGLSRSTVLKVVYDQEIEYSHKYHDRNKIAALFNQRQYCDDILIIKNGFVTDSSYSNIIFYDGVNWIYARHTLIKRHHAAIPARHSRNKSRPRAGTGHPFL